MNKIILCTLCSILLYACKPNDPCEEARNKPKPLLKYTTAFDSLIRWELPNKMRFLNLKTNTHFYVDVTRPVIETKLDEVFNGDETGCPYDYCNIESKFISFNGPDINLNVSVDYLIRSSSVSYDIDEILNFRGRIGTTNIRDEETLSAQRTFSLFSPPSSKQWLKVSYNDSTRVRDKWYKKVIIIYPVHEFKNYGLFYSLESGLITYFDNNVDFEYDPE